MCLSTMYGPQQRSLGKPSILKILSPAPSQARISHRAYRIVTHQESSMASLMGVWKHLSNAVVVQLVPPLLAEGGTRTGRGKEVLAGWKDYRSSKLSGSLTIKIRLLNSKSTKMLKNQALLVKYQRDHREPTWLRVKNRAGDDINKDGNIDCLPFCQISLWR